MVLTVKVEEPEPASEAGVNAPVAVGGRPLVLNTMVSFTPLKTVADTGKTAFPPADTVCDGASADIRNVVSGTKANMNVP